jgi:branched-chain amino acid transport system ATP-binding protein
MSIKPEALRVQNLSAKVGNLEIIKGASLSILRGEAVGIIGPNGSGKTTLFNSICGFISSTSGLIFLSGQEITHHSSYERSRLGLGRVFQNSGIFKSLTLLENMIISLELNASFSAKWLPFSRSHNQIKSIALEYLSKVKLQDKANDKAASLSGGQARLLEIARILAFGSDVILLDEPTAGVSPKMKESLINLLVEIMNLGKTLLIIEHDIQFIEKLTSRILVMEGGRIVLDDIPANVRTSTYLQEIYFGIN